MDELRCDYCRQLFIATEIFGGCSCCGAPAPEKMKLEWGISPVERVIRSGFLTPNEIREMFNFENRAHAMRSDDSLPGPIRLARRKVDDE